MQILRGVLGIAVLVGFAWLLSQNRRGVVWRTVVVGIGLQTVLALLVLRVGPVRAGFDAVSGLFVQVLGFSKEGASFIFGGLADRQAYGYLFAFQVLPSVIFFSALTSVLYFLGVLQWVVHGFAWVMSRLMRLSGTESLAAAANVFVGQTEAPLVVKPYVEKMTRSEVMALMVGGFATIAGAVMVAYIGMLGGESLEEQRKFASLLLCASVMNAPAALVVAKILVPETEPVNQELLIARQEAGENVLDALAKGTTQGLHLALNVGAMLLVFVALIALVNAILMFVGMMSWPGHESLNEAIATGTGGRFEKLTLQAILGFVFAPFAFVIGISGGDVLVVGQLLGEKMILTEFIAYGSLAELNEAGELSPRSVFIATFALCGFANFASIGIQLGGIGTLAPGQRATLAALGMKAMVGGTIACLLSASVAGMIWGG